MNEEGEHVGCHRVIRAAKSLSRRLILTLVACMLPVAAAAQQPVQDILSFLVTNQSIPTGDFSKDREAAEAARDTIARSLLATLATLPIGSSSGGFTYRFNPDLGIVERTSESFGPLFLERSLTTGRGEASFGVTYQFAQFNTLDGHGLREGTLVTTANRFRDEPEPFDVEALSLRMRTNTFTLFGSLGLTDRFDLGFALPIVALWLDGERVNTYRGDSLLQAQGSAFVTGPADTAVRAKFSLVERHGSGLAAGAEVRLPTGDSESLLGAGRTALRMLVAGSVEEGRAGAHFNAGYSIGGISRELSYGGAIAVAATPFLTFSGEFLARRVESIGRITQVTAPHPTILGVDTVRLASAPGAVNIVLAVGGFKWNAGGNWLVSGTVLVPMSDTGLQARFTPGLVVDYSFGR
jgi:hypothetical protein